MTTIVGTLALLLAHTGQADDSTGSTTPVEAPAVASLASYWHGVASVYGVAGRYSTDTDSRTLSAYITLARNWRDYYTLGYTTLWLERDDTGGKYYTQHFLVGRGSWLLTERIAAAVHYAYLDEGEIRFYSNPAVFHWVGVGASYWFSPFRVAGASCTYSFSAGSIASATYRAVHSFDAGAGIWLTSGVIVTDTDRLPRLLSFRQTVSFSLGNDSYLVATGDIGRRGFFFDDEALIVYNQRAVQRGGFILKGIMHIVSGLYLIPAFDYVAFDDYSVKYASLGIRAIF